MQLKLSKPNVLRIEAERAELRMTKILGRSVERDIFESICQNLVFVHLKLSTAAGFEKSELDLRGLSSLILEAVRAIRNIPLRIHSGCSIENESALQKILELTNEVLNLGIRSIQLTGDFSACQELDFQVGYFNLHILLTALKPQRTIVSLLIHGNRRFISYDVKYSGQFLNIGRLKKQFNTPTINPFLWKSKKSRLMKTGSDRNPHTGPIKTLNLQIPLNT